MPRKPRYYYQSSFYHIMVQGDEKKYIFKQEKYKKRYLYLLKHNAFRNDVEIIAYCLMDNHVHILIHDDEIKQITKLMQKTNTSYAKLYNSLKKRVGSLTKAIL